MVDMDSMKRSTYNGSSSRWDLMQDKFTKQFFTFEFRIIEFLYYALKSFFFVIFVFFVDDVVPTLCSNASSSFNDNVPTPAPAPSMTSPTNAASMKSPTPANEDKSEVEQALEEAEANKDYAKLGQLAKEVDEYKGTLFKMITKVERSKSFMLKPIFIF